MCYTIQIQPNIEAIMGIKPSPECPMRATSFKRSPSNFKTSKNEKEDNLKEKVEKQLEECGLPKILPDENDILDVKLLSIPTPKTSKTQDDQDEMSEYPMGFGTFNFITQQGFWE